LASGAKFIAVLLLCLQVAAQYPELKKRKGKKEVEPVTQVHELSPDPPPAVKVESSRLSFFASPLSAKGLLSQQTRDALNAIRKQAHGATLVKVRAFVAGRGDARRVATIVSEQVSEWKQPLPALTILQVGALPLEGAQVWLEGIAEERKPVNLNGVAWLEAKQVTKPLGESGDVNAVLPLLEESLAALKGELLAVTCFVSSLDEVGNLDKAIAARFPVAARTLVQAQRATGSGLARCEGVARRSMGDPGRLVLTGTVIGFGGEAQNVQNVEVRLARLLEANNATLLTRRTYAVSRSLELKLGPTCIVEGVGTNEATFAVEAVALQKP